MRWEHTYGSDWIKTANAGGYFSAGDDPGRTTWFDDEMEALTSTARLLGMPCSALEEYAPLRSPSGAPSGVRRNRRSAVAMDDEQLIPHRDDHGPRDISPNDPRRGHPSSRLPTAADLTAIRPPPLGISPRADIGHVNLTVTDLERSLSFYRDALGLHITQRDEQSAFLAAGEYHHHIALNTWDAQAHTPPPHSAGLHHFGLRLPDTTALAQVVVRLLTAGHELLGATDHGVNLAVYLLDPDGNGVELMVDRPRTDWPRSADGSIAMRVAPLDLRALVTEMLA